jgi:hypothetical protein
MTGCEQYQAQLLPYLYDLLDPADRQALDTHLAQCSACATALAQAQRQQRLLAAAAKAEFAGVRFEPPAPQAARATVPAAVRMESRRRSWPRFALAASILFLSLATPAGWWTVSYVQTEHREKRAEERYTALQSKAQANAARIQENINHAAHEVGLAQRRVNEAALEYQKNVAELQQKIRSRQLDVVVSGPEHLQPGAPNEYNILTRNLNNQPVPAKLKVRVVDENQQVVYERKDVTTAGSYRVVLQPDLPVKPNQQLALEVVAHRDGLPEGSIKEQISLVAPVYLTHLATDKPMYRPGETVHFRSLTLERFSLKPANEDFHLVYTVTTPNGEEVFRLAGGTDLRQANSNAPLTGPDGKPLHGLGAGDFPIDPAAKGGEYTLTVRDEANRFPPQERKFIVNQYENPRLNKELDFTRKSYGPADEVVAACKATRVEGGPVANRPVTATVQLDGKPAIAPLGLKTDAAGAVVVRFKLPQAIERGLGTLSVQFTDGGNVETLVRPIPIVLKKLQVEFFPEGGDLVAGLPNRVYFQARTMLGKPAELRGRIVDTDGKVVAETVQTLHDDKFPGVNQGMGLFAFTPEAGKKYELKIDLPTGMEGKYELPAAKEDGVVLNVADGVIDARKPIHVSVQTARQERKLLVGAYCRGRLMDHQPVTAKPGQPATVELKPVLDAGGVFRVTVFEERAGAGQRVQLVPLAERLLYRKPAEELILTAKPDKKQCAPGEKVRFSLHAVNEKEQPAPAIVMVAVVDKSVITMADEKTARTMPTHYFLTTEVRHPEDLEYADFLLSDKPKAAAALDLLLGTQGWRRFAEQNPGKFQQQYGNDADRLLLAMGQSPTINVDLGQNELAKLQTNFEADRVKLTEQLTNAVNTVAALHNNPEYQEQTNALQAEMAKAQQDRAAAADRLAYLRELAAKLRHGLLLIVPALLLVGLVLCLILAVRRGLAHGIPLYATAGVCALMIGALVWVSSPNEVARALQVPVEQPRDELAAVTTLHAQPKSASSPMPLAPKGKAEVLRDGMVPAPLAVPQEQAPVQLQLERQQPWMLGAMMNGAAGMAGKGQANGPMAPAPMFATPAPGANLNFGLQMGQQLPTGAPGVDKLGENLYYRDLGRLQIDAKQRGVEAELSKEAAGKDMNFAFRAADKKPAQKPVDRELKQLAERAKRPTGFAGGFGGMREGRGAGGRARMPGMPENKPGLQAPLGGVQGIPRAGGAVLRRRLAPEQRLELQDRQLMVGKKEALIAPVVPLVVREYAHQRAPGTPAEVRSDFVDTVYWHPALVLPGGQADVTFDLCDSVTTYQVAAFGHTLDGRLGAVSTTFESVLPFTLEPKVPIEVTAGDTIDLPVTVANNTDERREVDLRLAATNLHQVTSTGVEHLTVDADGRSRQIFHLEPAVVEGSATVHLDGQSRPFTDTITRTFRVVPQGFPFVGSHSDMLEGVARQEIVLPETWVKGTLKCQVSVYPSTLADLQKGLEALLREPGGCFEQTSTTNYPNVLILDYLHENNVTDAALEQRARNLLASGYRQLTAFECQDPSAHKRQGYEWFGGTAPPHEALTAYGLLEFRDMARVYDVDRTMLERTRQYLMSCRDGKGGFRRNPQALDSFGRAPDNVTNAYIVWALTESGKEDDVEKELSALSAQAKDSKDPYFLSLVATSLINRGKANEGVALLKTVAAAQKDDGHLDAATTSITSSGGRDLQIETTALAVLGWLKANRPADFNVPLQKAIKWIGQQRGGYGGFGSTQSTILALKSLIAYTRANKKTAEAGTLSLAVGDETVAHLDFPAGAQDALVLAMPEADKHLKPGKNTVRVSLTGKSSFPYTLTWSYQTLKPVSAEACPVRLDTKLDRADATEGETVHLTVTMENVQDKGQGMAVAIVGLPAGLTLPEDMKQLKDYARLRNDGKEKGLIGAWETRGRELILYWRDLAPRQKIEVPVDLICRVPGKYSGPASRGYLYYNADLKNWVEPLKIHIAAKYGLSG